MQSLLFGILNKVGRQLIPSQKEDTIAEKFADSDNFKNYNDTYGHISGNIFLKRIAKEFEKFIGQNGIISRYGGDEFVVLLEKHDGNLLEYVNDLKKYVEDNLNKDANKIRVTFSMGYAVFPKDGKTSEDIVSRADKSLYKAKSLGKDRVCYI